MNRIIRRQWRHLLVAVYAPSRVKFPRQIMGFYFLMSWLNFRALFLIRFASPLKLDRLSLPAPTIMSPIQRGFSLLRR